MRLSEWRTAAPSREAMSGKVLAVVEPVVDALGAEPDPQAWVIWGDDPAVRYVILVGTPTGLITCHVRVNVPGEGPRTNAKLARWSRVQLGELAVEMQGGHRVVTFQVDQLVVRGVDAEGDGVAEFAVGILAAADGRPIPEPAKRRSRTGRATRNQTAASSRATATSRTAAGTGRSRSTAAATPTGSKRPASRTRATEG